MANRIALAAVVCLGLHAAAWAQEQEDLPSVAVHGGVEYWKTELDTVSSDTIMTFDDEIMHSLGRLAVEYRFPSENVLFRARAGLGLEVITATREDAFDIRFDESPALDLGVGVEMAFERAFAGLSVDFRMGEAEADPWGGFDVEYKYQHFRIGAKFGFAALPSLRPYLGLRYNLYDSELDLNGIDYEYEFEEPFGISLGFDVHAERVLASFEILFLDVDLGVMATVGHRF